jgi:hypothetical protein
MAASGGARVWWKAKAVDDRAKRQDRHKEESEVEVAQLGSGGRVAVCVGNQAQGNGADGDTHTHAELHDGAEEAVSPAHSGGWNFGVGERSQAGELHRSQSPVAEEDAEDKDRSRSRTQRRAKGHR